MQPDSIWRGSIAILPAPARPGIARTVVLVVSNDVDLREAAARALGREGYQVITAAHAGHAVLACIKAGRVDLLVAELSMEDVSGPALAARLRRHCPDMAAVFLGNAGTPECEGVLVRPFTRDDLIAALTAASGRRQGLTLTSAF